MSKGGDPEQSVMWEKRQRREGGFKVEQAKAATQKMEIRQRKEEYHCFTVYLFCITH